MKINELIDRYKTDEFFLTDKDFMNKISVTSYIPIQEKRMIVRDILDKCMDDHDGFVTIDEVDKEIYLTLIMLREYHGLEISDDYDSMVAEYDTLAKSGVLEWLRTDVRDKQVLQDIMYQEQHAILARNSMGAQVAKVANALVGAIEGITNKFEGAINGLDVNKIIPDGVDVKQLMEFVSKYK